MLAVTLPLLSCLMRQLYDSREHFHEGLAVYGLLILRDVGRDPIDDVLLLAARQTRHLVNEQRTRQYARTNQKGRSVLSEDLLGEVICDTEEITYWKACSAFF